MHQLLNRPTHNAVEFSSSLPVGELDCLHTLEKRLLFIGVEHKIPIITLYQSKVRTTRVQAGVQCGVTVVVSAVDSTLAALRFVGRGLLTALARLLVAATSFCKTMPS